MRRVVETVAAVMLITSIAEPASTTKVAGPVATENQIVELEHQWVNAALKGNAEAFAEFMADDYIAVSNGRMRDKRAWVEAVRSGSRTYQSVDLRNLRVRVYGNTAVVSGEYAQKGFTGGEQDIATGVYVTTWLKRHGRWQAIASGFSRVPT